MKFCIVIIKELFSIKGTTLFVWLTQKKFSVSIEKHQIVLCLQAMAALLRELLVSNIHGFLHSPKLSASIIIFCGFLYESGFHPRVPCSRVPANELSMSQCFEYFLKNDACGTYKIK